MLCVYVYLYIYIYISCQVSFYPCTMKNSTNDLSLALKFFIISKLILFYRISYVFTVSNWFEKLDNFIFTAKFQVYTLLRVKRFLVAAIDGERDFLLLVDVLKTFTIIKMEITILKPLQTLQPHHLALVLVLLFRKKPHLMLVLHVLQ